jgi:hypothetical protein
MLDATAASASLDIATTPGGERRRCRAMYDVPCLQCFRI